VADALARAEILERERPLRFVHPLVRTAVYEDMQPSARSRLHARAARLIRENDCGAGDVAVHLLLTDPADDPGDVEMDGRRSAYTPGRAIRSWTRWPICVPYARAGRSGSLKSSPQR